MTGYVTLSDGSTLEFPTLLSWKLTYTDGEPCGYFSLSCLSGQVWGAEMGQGGTLYLEEDGAVVFCGVVDELGFSASYQGYFVTLEGRDLAGILLDNQVRSAQFITAQLGDILSTYVYPYGITKIAYDTLPSVTGFSVDSGESCWRVLEGFCRHSSGICPRFLPDGTLALGYGSGNSHTLGGGDPVVSLSWLRDFATELSAFTQVDLTYKTVSTHENPLWVGGGRRENVVIRSGYTVPADYYSPSQRLAESSQGRCLLVAVLSGKSEILPLDTVAVSLPDWNILGDYTAQEVVYSCQNGEITTTLTLRRL